MCASNANSPQTWNLPATDIFRCMHAPTPLVYPKSELEQYILLTCTKVKRALRIREVEPKWKSRINGLFD